MAILISNRHGTLLRGVVRMSVACGDECLFPGMLLLGFLRLYLVGGDLLISETSRGSSV